MSKFLDNLTKKPESWRYPKSCSQSSFDVTNRNDYVTKNHANDVKFFSNFLSNDEKSIHIASYWEAGCMRKRPNEPALQKEQKIIPVGIKYKKIRGKDKLIYYCEITKILSTDIIVIVRGDRLKGLSGPYGKECFIK
jgi:hypothetical protein